MLQGTYTVHMQHSVCLTSCLSERSHTGSKEESGEAPAAPLETIDLTLELPEGTQLDALAEPPSGVEQEAAADADDDEDWEDAASPRTSLAEHAVCPHTAWAVASWHLLTRGMPGHIHLSSMRV